MWKGRWVSRMKRDPKCSCCPSSQKGIVRGCGSCVNRRAEAEAAETKSESQLPCGKPISLIHSDSFSVLLLVFALPFLVSLLLPGSFETPQQHLYSTQRQQRTLQVSSVLPIDAIRPRKPAANGVIPAKSSNLSQTPYRDRIPRHGSHRAHLARQG